MGMFHKVQVGEKSISPIDWEMSPELTFGTYESWGGRERVRNNDEQIYYFFIDNWGEEPKLCLMERAVKHAKIIATINAPKNLMQECVKNAGSVALFEQSFAINENIKNWLINNVLDNDRTDLVVPMVEKETAEKMGSLPTIDTHKYAAYTTSLPCVEAVINDDQIEGIIKENNFFDVDLNPAGYFENHLIDNGNGQTVSDLRTGLEWQQAGIDIRSIRSMNRAVEELNKKGFAGHNDWRLPTMEEAMSLMEPNKNDKALYLNPCFSKEQPFIFVAAQRQPGGYWFVDFKHGRAFWSSGTIPGGFGRLCRTIN